MAFLTGSKIDEFCTKGLPVWVKNKTGIVLLIPLGGGEAESLRIGPGQEPFCISDYLPPNTIRDASTLRRLISEGKLLLMDPSDPKIAGKRSVAPVRGLAGDGMSAKERAAQHSVAQQDISGDLDPDLEVVEASPKVSLLCDAITQKDIKPDLFFEKIAEIESKDGLTENDISYIISELKDYPSIVEWTTDRLAAAREAVENDDEDEEVEEGLSTGTDEDLDENAKELIARSKPQGANLGEGPDSTKVQHNTMTPKERKVFRGTSRG